MSTTALLDRLANWALDPRGDSYGDERERLRHYEGLAIAALVQFVAVPTIAAIIVWTGGRPVAPTVALLMTAYYLPVFWLYTLYLRRSHVQPQVTAWTAARIGNAVLAFGPLAAVVTGCLAAFHQPGKSWWGMAAGAAGGAIVGLALARVSRVRTRRATAGDDRE